MSRIVLLCMSLITTQLLSAEEVLKVTYAANGIGSQGASSALEFTPYAMVVAAKGGSFSDIERVEFYDDQSVVMTEGRWAPIAVKEGFIGFDATGGALSLTLPKALALTVSLCTPDGKSVAVLYCGESSTARLPLHIGDYGLASGQYSLVVATEEALFVRSLSLR